MKDPVLAKLIDLTECSNKVEQCLHELGIGSYGTLLMLARELKGPEFQQAVSAAETAKANPLSEDEQESLQELHALTLSMRAGLWEQHRTWMLWGVSQMNGKPAKKPRSGASPEP